MKVNSALFKTRGKNIPYNRGNSTPLLYFFGGIRMLESKFQAGVIKEVKQRLPGCVVLKNDANYIQGIPDLTVFYNDKWAMLECKKSEHEEHQPNQDYYVERANQMSFARFIFPENKKEVLDELCQTLQSGR